MTRKQHLRSPAEKGEEAQEVLNFSRRNPYLCLCDMRKLKTIELRRPTVEEYRQQAKMPLVVVLDDVRSQYNVGSVLRTADAFAVEAVLLCGITACPPTAEIHKTALGAEDSVAWHYYPSAVSAVTFLKEQGYVLLAAEQCDDSVLLPLDSLDPARRYAVVVGNEVKGVQQEVVDLCDGSIEIPQFGTKHSLNVAVAAGIVMWEFCRHWQR